MHNRVAFYLIDQELWRTNVVLQIWLLHYLPIYLALCFSSYHHIPFMMQK